MIKRITTKTIQKNKEIRGHTLNHLNLIQGQIYQKAKFLKKVVKGGVKSYRKLEVISMIKVVFFQIQ